MTLRYQFKSGNILIIDVIDNIMYFRVNDGIYYATYPKGFNMLDVDKMYFDLMIYVLFYGLERMELQPGKINYEPDKKPLVSYSGGADSTAALFLTNGQAVHITRDWMPEYESRQIKAVYEVSGLQIKTNIELMRRPYELKHGFNVGIGYISMMIPLLPILNKNTIALGTVYDDIAFYYGNPFAYNRDFSKSKNWIIIQKLKEYGIEIINPLATISEVHTTRIAKLSGIKYSSCHTYGTGQACKACYKCFRKFGIQGIKIPLNHNILTILSKKPLKMALSTTYAIQKAGYDIPSFKRLKDIDVSFVERADMSISKWFGEFDHNIPPMDESDYNKIDNFVEQINRL